MGYFQMSDILSENQEMISSTDLEESFSLKTNFLKYGNIYVPFGKYLKSCLPANVIPLKKDIGTVNIFLINYSTYRI